MSNKAVITFKGKPINDMTREELLKVVYDLYADAEDLKTVSAKLAESAKDVEKLLTALRPK